ncbi:MAG TPA: isoprenylcysteine carboxylmethyltransferase family protein [Steroidobacteraceae bacterium]
MSLRLKIPPPIWALLFGTLMWVLDRALPVVRMIGTPLNRAGWLVVAAGFGIIITAMLHFRRARTTVNPLTPAKASALVTEGIFGYSRNPMYLGLSIALAGWAIVLGSLGPWIGVPLFVLVMTRLQIQPEEAVLSVLFDTAYRDYCARVGRWFGRRSENR